MLGVYRFDVCGAATLAAAKDRRQGACTRGPATVPRRFCRTVVPHPAGKALAHAKLDARDGGHAQQERSYRAHQRSDQDRTTPARRQRREPTESRPKPACEVVPQVGPSRRRTCLRDAAGARPDGDRDVLYFARGALDIGFVDRRGCAHDHRGQYRPDQGPRNTEAGSDEGSSSRGEPRRSDSGGCNNRLLFLLVHSWLPYQHPCQASKA